MGFLEGSTWVLYVIMCIFLLFAGIGLFGSLFSGEMGVIGATAVAFAFTLWYWAILRRCTNCKCEEKKAEAFY